MLSVTELLQSSTLQAQRNHLIGHSQSVCKEFTPCTNLMHFDNCILRGIDSIRQISALFLPLFFFLMQIKYDMKDKQHFDDILQFNRAIPN
jgi:hypothetical protein